MAGLPGREFVMKILECVLPWSASQSTIVTEPQEDERS